MVYSEQVNNAILNKNDNPAPADKTLRLAKKAERLTFKTYDCGHFNIYLSPFFEEVTEDYINFYNQIEF